MLVPGSGVKFPPLQLVTANFLTAAVTRGIMFFRLAHPSENTIKCLTNLAVAFPGPTKGTIRFSVDRKSEGGVTVTSQPYVSSEL